MKGHVIYFTLLGNKVITVARSGEDYTNLKTVFGNVTQSVSELVSKRCITVEDRDVPIEVFIGGDYKVSTFSLKEIKSRREGGEIRAYFMIASLVRKHELAKYS